MAKRALLVGAGGMGRAWANNLVSNERAQLCAWVDVRPGAASIAARELQIEAPLTGEDLVAAAEATMPDFIVDVTPPEVHCEIVTKALGMGLPVLGEKPMADSMAHAREMVNASERAGKLYMVSQSRRYDPGIVAFRQLIRERLRGLDILNVDFYIGAHFGGFRDDMPSPLILDMAIHTFDEARFLSGADAVSVYAEEFNPRWSWYQGDACASVLFQMGDGLRFNYRGSWCAEGLPTSWDGDWRAIGPKGTAVWVRNGDPEAEVVVKSEGFHSETEKLVETKPSIPQGIAGSLGEFLDALEGGPVPQGECHDNIKSLAMVFGAIESSRQGRRVKVEA